MYRRQEERVSLLRDEHVVPNSHESIHTSIKKRNLVCIGGAVVLLVFFVVIVDMGVQRGVAESIFCNKQVPESVFGKVCGWVSGLLYFFSRVPQLVENRRRKSVAGLSVGLFVLTVLGNVW